MVFVLLFFCHMVWHLGSILQPGIEPMCSAVEMWDLWTSRKVPVCVFLCHQAIQSVQFSRSVVSDSLRPHELQHARPPCPSPTLGVYSNSCPSSRWCHPAISSSVVPFSSCPQFFPASGSFPSESPLCIRRPRYWSFSFSISPCNEYFGLISFRID